MSTISLWRFPKSLIPELKEAYLNNEFMWLISKYNEFMVGERLCPTCPDSIQKIKAYLKPIFLADAEVLFREKRKAGKKELIELWLKHVAPECDPVTVSAIPDKYLKSVIVTFVNSDLKARGFSQRRRKLVLNKVFDVARGTFNLNYCDDCEEKRNPEINGVSGNNKNKTK